MFKKLSFGLATCALSMASLASATVLTPGSAGAPDRLARRLDVASHHREPSPVVRDVHGKCDIMGIQRQR